MKPISVSILYGKDVPNIPVLKAKLKKVLNENELNYAKDIATEFSSNTLISKVFFSAKPTASSVELSRKFKLAHPKSDLTHPGFNLKNEILEYAALIIFGNLFINDLCPDILDVTLSHVDTENIPCDFAFLEFTSGTPTNIFEITLSTRALY